MHSYAVFFRGINVGGVTIRMPALREAQESRRFSGVQTLLASGDVLLANGLDPAAVKAEVEACLRETLGYDAWVVVLPGTRVAELAASLPYLLDDATTHTYLTLASSPEVLAELSEAGRVLDGRELVRLGPEWPGWRRPEGARTAGSASFPPGRSTRRPSPPGTCGP